MKDESQDWATKITIMIREMVRPAPSGPAPASQEPVRLPVEPILFEKNGWGIYTDLRDESNEGSCLTHIGCDCDFPYWAFGQISLKAGGSPILIGIRCTECGEVLDEETYRTIVTVYRFINNL